MDGFEIEEVFTEDGDLLVLSLGFVSAGDPLDILHVACGRRRGGCQPPRVEDLLYLERTDQDLACDGREVIRLAARLDHVELVLSEAGARLLQLPRLVRFRFGAHPELLSVALA
ncbi:MAG: hypothetical protein EOP19_15670, partial [Hyphomicrobiales bacterium]